MPGGGQVGAVLLNPDWIKAGSTDRRGHLQPLLGAAHLRGPARHQVRRRGRARSPGLRGHRDRLRLGRLQRPARGGGTAGLPPRPPVPPGTSGLGARYLDSIKTRTRTTRSSYDGPMGRRGGRHLEPAPVRAHLLYRRYPGRQAARSAKYSKPCLGANDEASSGAAARRPVNSTAVGDRTRTEDDPRRIEIPTQVIPNERWCPQEPHLSLGETAGYSLALDFLAVHSRWFHSARTGVSTGTPSVAPS